MSTKDTEIAVQDAELDELMAQLEAETANAVAAPPPIVKKAADPEPLPWNDDPPLEEVGPPSAKAKAVLESLVPTAAAPVPAPETVAAAVAEELDEGDIDDLEATLRESVRQAAEKRAAAEPVLVPATPAPTKAPVVAAAPVPTPSPAPAPAEPANDPVAPPPARAPGLQHSVDVAAFKSETAINPTNMDQAFIEQSALRATYAEIAARAAAQADRVKVQVEIKEAELYDKHRKLLAASGEKVTEKAVENAVKLDPIWAKIKSRLIEADTIAAINKGLIASLSDRKDMLVQLGADRREEGKGALRILDNNELRERAQAAARR